MRPIFNSCSLIGFSFLNRFKLLSIALIPLGIFIHSLSAQKQVFFWSMQAADPAINETDSFNYSVVDPQLARGRLLVFLPGTGALPLGYSKFLNNAADLGFHSMGILYEPILEESPSGTTQIAVNELCAWQDPSNSNAHAEVRMEIIDGVDRTDLVTISFEDSIENRLLRSLQHLAQQFPSQGWEQYFEGNKIIWDKIAVAGHSQGGGYAALIAKSRLVERCLIFSSLDFYYKGARLADWVFDVSATDVSKIYYAVHEKDEVFTLLRYEAMAYRLGLKVYGDSTRVEESNNWKDYFPSHYLKSDIKLPVLPEGSLDFPNFYHNPESVR